MKALFAVLIPVKRTFAVLAIILSLLFLVAAVLIGNLNSNTKCAAVEGSIKDLVGGIKA